MARGIITSYYENEKFGYIQDAEGQKVFFHHSDMDSAVKVGDSVEFDITEGGHSLQAVYIKKSD